MPLRRGEREGPIVERLLAKPSFPHASTIYECSYPESLIVSAPTQPFTISPSKFAATVSFASVRPLATISSTERRMRVASG